MTQNLILALTIVLMTGFAEKDTEFMFAHLKVSQSNLLTAEQFRLKMANLWMCKLIAEILCMPADASRSFPRSLGTPP
jgi:hypothetical protein